MSKPASASTKAATVSLKFRPWVEFLILKCSKRCCDVGCGVPQWPLPDLIVLDGGKGQLSAAKQVIGEAKVQLASVAKGPTRKRTDLYGEGWAVFPLVEHVAWHQIAEILREEAHRF